MEGSNEELKEKQNKVKINSSEHYESDYRRAESEKEEKEKDKHQLKRKTDKLQQRVKELLLLRKENTHRKYSGGATK